MDLTLIRESRMSVFLYGKEENLAEMGMNLAESVEPCRNESEPCRDGGKPCRVGRTLRR